MVAPSPLRLFAAWRVEAPLSLSLFLLGSFLVVAFSCLVSLLLAMKVFKLMHMFLTMMTTAAPLRRTFLDVAICLVTDNTLLSKYGEHGKYELCCGKESLHDGVSCSLPESVENRGSLCMIPRT